MGHPSEYFLRFTLAQGWGDDDADSTHAALNETLKAFGLVQLLEEQYNRLMATFNPPEGFRFHSSKNSVTKKFMGDEKISALWKAGKVERRVINELIDGHSMIKQDLHLLLMGGLPRDVIADKLNTKYRLSPEITQGMVDMYYHYFWNVGNVTSDEWEKLLAGNRQRDAFMAALYCGEQQSLYRAGFSPRVDGNRAMKEAFRQAYFRLEALRFEPDTKSTIDSYSKLTARMMGLHEVLYAQGSGLQDQLKQFVIRKIRHLHVVGRASEAFEERHEVRYLLDIQAQRLQPRVFVRGVTTTIVVEPDDIFQRRQ